MELAVSSSLSCCPCSILFPLFHFQVDSKFAQGLYNPHTMHGDIVVNGIRTSSYTAAINPILAHAALWPVRMLFSMGVDVINGAFDHGSELLVSVMPAGRQQY